MPDPLAPLWGPLPAVRRAVPDRPCGCVHDPHVFGHYHPFGEGTVT